VAAQRRSGNGQPAPRAKRSISRAPLWTEKNDGDVEGVCLAFFRFSLSGSRSSPPCAIGGPVHKLIAMYPGRHVQQEAEDAIVEAQRRWGPTGAISISDQWQNARYLVGELRGSRFWIHGRGSTWAAAFVDAEARGLSASRRKAAR
jgi:hypothetical protein